jgi:hypothetical protein
VYPVVSRLVTISSQPQGYCYLTYVYSTDLLFATMLFGFFVRYFVVFLCWCADKRGRVAGIWLLRVPTCCGRNPPHEEDRPLYYLVLAWVVFVSQSHCGKIQSANVGPATDPWVSLYSLGCSSTALFLLDSGFIFGFLCKRFPS